MAGSLHRSLLVRDQGECAARLQAAIVTVLRVLRRRLVGIEQAEGLRVARHRSFTGSACGCSQRVATSLPLPYATSAESSLVVIVSRKQLLLQVSALGRALRLQDLCWVLVEDQTCMVTVSVLLRA